jgi:hypothetical protein
LFFSHYLFVDNDIRATFVVLSIIGFVFSLIVQIARYWMQSDNIEEYAEMKADIEVYKRQCSDLLAEVKLYLIDKFPEHELKVFDKITNNTASFLATDYPELKSDETFKQAVDSIMSYKNKVYNTERKINGKVREIKARKRSIWLTSLPILPDSKGIEYGLKQTDGLD